MAEIDRSAQRDPSWPTAVDIYDTTLRDGSQLEGISLTVDDKLRIAEQLDRLGVAFQALYACCTSGTKNTSPESLLPPGFGSFQPFSMVV